MPDYNNNHNKSTHSQEGPSSNDISNNSNNFTRNFTSPNLLEYGGTAQQQQQQQGHAYYSTRYVMPTTTNNTNTNTTNNNSLFSRKPQQQPPVILAVEDEDDPHNQMLMRSLSLPDDVIPGPPLPAAGNRATNSNPKTNTTTTKEKSLSKSRGLLQRMIHVGNHSSHSTTTTGGASSPSKTARIVATEQSTNSPLQSSSSSSSLLFLHRKTSSMTNINTTTMMMMGGGGGGGDELQLSNTEHNWAGAGILANRQDLDMPAEDFAAGCNLLQAAARGDMVAMRQLLAMKKTHVDFRDYDRRTALHVAASEGHLSVCQMLLEDYKAKINRSDRWGGSPLDDAHRHRHQQVAMYLRSRGATTGSGNRLVNFIKAAADGDLDEVRLILDAAKKEASMSSSTETSNNNDNTNSSNGKAGAAGRVITRFDINKGDYDNRTALHLAAGEGHVTIVEALCEAGANVNVEDRWRRTPLDDAIQSQHTICQQVLEKYGGRVGTSSIMTGGGAPQPEPSQDFLDESGKRQQDNMQVQFDELEMIDKIGSGAFGEIYKCRWRGTLVAAKIIKTAKIRRDWVNKRMAQAISEGKDVDEAVKEIDEAEMDQDAKDVALADFRQEISVLKGLRHPHIVLLLAYSTTQNYECLISELMKCSLLDIFKAHIIQGSKMRLRTAIVYARQLAQGMTYLHSCRPPIIHRDLKPANLLIDHSGMLKISDFGLSKVRPDPEKKEVDTFRMTGETGSYRFMAPEVFRHQDYNETVDIYSYAMILYYLLVGRPPWPQLPGMEAVKRATEEGDRPTIPREMDARLQSLMKECWDENPSLRPPFTTITKMLAAFSKDVFKENENDVSVAPPAEVACDCDDYCRIM